MSDNPDTMTCGTCGAHYRIVVGLPVTVTFRGGSAIVELDLGDLPIVDDSAVLLCDCAQPEPDEEVADRASLDVGWLAENAAPQVEVSIG